MDLTLPKFESVFSLTTQGHYSGNPDRVGLETHVSVVSMESDPTERIQVVYGVRFTHQGETLGYRSDEAVFIRRGENFVFDASRSKTPKADIDNIYGLEDDHPSNEDYLRYLLPELKKIAAGPPSELKDWLKRFLETCGNTAEKREIQAAIDRSTPEIVDVISFAEERSHSHPYGTKESVRLPAGVAQSLRQIRPRRYRPPRLFGRRAKFAVGGLTATMIWESLRPNYAWAQQVPKDDKRIKAEYLTVPSPQGNGSIKGYFVRPANATGKLPGVLVVHENRGLNPYIEDVARRLGTANFMAFAPDGLTSVGGYPGNEETGAANFRKVDGQKMGEDFHASARWLKARTDCTGKVGAVGFCYRRRRRQHARREDGRGSGRRRSVLRRTAQGRRCGPYQSAARAPLRLRRRAHHRRMARL